LQLKLKIFIDLFFKKNYALSLKHTLEMMMIYLGSPPIQLITSSVQIRWDIPDSNPDLKQLFSYQYLREAVYDIKSWSIKARERGIDITEQLKKIKQIVDDMPPFTYPENNFKTEVILIYQNKMHRYYLCEIIREYTKKMIEKLHDDGNKHCALNQHKLRVLNHSVNWLKEKLFPPVSILYNPVNYEVIALDMQQNSNDVVSQIDNVREKLNIG
jgi:hypothetical protein